jgi:hypothetical protein
MAILQFFQKTFSKLLVRCVCPFSLPLVSCVVDTAVRAGGCAFWAFLETQRFFMAFYLRFDWAN